MCIFRDIPKGGVAFFDSGIGGLTVLATCKKYIEEGIFYYYGDNTHAPYGNLSSKRIQRYVFKIFKKFQRLKVRAVVIACNTATAVCMDELRKKFHFPIIGIEPAVRNAAKSGGEILVLATCATCNSKRFHLLCQKTEGEYPDAEIKAVACEDLAGAIEKNISNDEYDYAPLLPMATPDAVVLGCTHYVYIEEAVKARYACPIYHGNEGVAKRLLELLSTPFVENRDGKPLLKKIGEFLGKLSTRLLPFRKNFKKNTNANKSSCLVYRNPCKIKGKREIYFLGKSAKYNENIYKNICSRKVGI